MGFAIKDILERIRRLEGRFPKNSQTSVYEGHVHKGLGTGTGTTSPTIDHQHSDTGDGGLTLDTAKVTIGDTNSPDNAFLDLIHGSSFSWHAIASTSLTGNVNDYDPTTPCNIIIFDSDGAYNITGIVQPTVGDGLTEGRVVLVYNTSAFTLTLKDQDGASLPSSQFKFGSDLALPSERIAFLWYGSDENRWHTLAVGAGAGSGNAPSTADYLVGTEQAGLSAEIVVGTTPGGELGGTWGSPTVNATHSGSSHAALPTQTADINMGGFDLASLGSVLFSKQTTAVIDANDEIAVPTATWVYLNATGASDSLDGIGAGTEGQILILTPVAGKNIQLVHNGTVTAGKKLMINANANYLMADDHDMAIAIYDATALVWNVLVPGAPKTSTYITVSDEIATLTGSRALGAALPISVTDSGAGAGVDISIATATASTEGAVELATDAEVLTGTDTTRAITPAGLKNSHTDQADPHTGYVLEASVNYVDLTDGGATTLHSHTGGSAGANGANGPPGEDGGSAETTYVGIPTISIANADDIPREPFDISLDDAVPHATDTKGFRVWEGRTSSRKWLAVANAEIAVTAPNVFAIYQGVTLKDTITIAAAGTRILGSVAIYPANLDRFTVRHTSGDATGVRYKVSLVQQ